MKTQEETVVQEEEVPVALESVIKSIFDGIKDQHIEFYKKIIGENEKNFRRKDIESPENFFYSIQYKFEQFTSGLLRKELNASNDVVFIFQHYKFIDTHFAKLFTDIEGRSCSSDKSRTIVESLVEFYATGKTIEFNYDQQYTFHLPKTIFKTHESIISFYKALQSLYYGNPQKYFDECRKLMSQVS